GQQTADFAEETAVDDEHDEAEDRAADEGCHDSGDDRRARGIVEESPEPLRGHDPGGACDDGGPESEQRPTSDEGESGGSEDAVHVREEEHSSHCHAQYV